MDLLRHPHFAPGLAAIGAVLILIGFAAWKPEGGRAFKVFGAIVLMLAAALSLAGRH